MLELPVVGLNIANCDDLNFKHGELKQWLSLKGITYAERNAHMT